MLSVIIPCYNSEKYVHNAIESVLNQTYSDYEIILVDNNSTDNTINILNKYLSNYPEKIKIFREYTKGAPATRNKGLKEARGQWIQFLDSDDELLSNKFETQLLIVSDLKIDLVVGSSFMHKIKNGEINKTIRHIETRNVWEALLTSKLGITSANLWRREAVLAVNGWSESKSSSQEYDLIFRMMKNNENIGFCTLPLAIVNVRENSVHKSADKNRFIEILNNNISLRVEIKEYLKLKQKLTQHLEKITDEYIYSYLLNATGVTPLFKSRTMVHLYVKKILKNLNLNLSFIFLMKFYYKFFKYKFKNRILFAANDKGQE